MQNNTKYGKVTKYDGFTGEIYDNRHRVWRGRAIAVVRGNGKGGKATLTVTGNGLPKAQVTLNGKR